MGVLSWCLARACEMASCINLLIYSCAVFHSQVILFRSLETLYVKFHSSCMILPNYCRMIVDW